jgi:hypothetical protein
MNGPESGINGTEKIASIYLEIKLASIAHLVVELQKLIFVEAGDGCDVSAQPATELGPSIPLNRKGGLLCKCRFPRRI